MKREHEVREAMLTYAASFLGLVILFVLCVDANWRATEGTRAELSAAKEIAERADRAKSEFLTVMSHEMRTPLGAIVGMAELTAATELNARQAEFVSTIQASSEGLLSLINDVLDFPKIEAGLMDIERTDFELREIVEQAMEVTGVQASTKGLEITCEVEPSVPGRATFASSGTRSSTASWRPTTASSRSTTCRNEFAVLPTRRIVSRPRTAGRRKAVTRQVGRSRQTGRRPLASGRG